MRNKFFSSFRWKIILSFIMSIILSVAVTYVLFGIADILYNYDTFYRLFRKIKSAIGIMPAVVATGSGLFILFLFLLTQDLFNYIEEIQRGLEQIENGRFDIKIPIKSRDELGKLADSINRMTYKLKDSIEKERNIERAKNELITSVSHDLRTPLSSILGYLDLIVNGNCTNENDTKRYANIALKKSKKLRKLIDELFELTRMTYQGIKINPSKLNFVELIQQMAEEFYPLFEDAEMECRLSVPKEDIFIYADGDMIARVLENLMTNAIRYGKQGKYIDIELTKNIDSVIVKIINYGQVIPQKDLPHIFDKFYRVESSRSEATGGTGLGLAIAKNIIELHKGKIKAYSNNQQTTFEVELNK